MSIEGIVWTAGAAICTALLLIGLFAIDGLNPVPPPPPERKEE